MVLWRVREYPVDKSIIRTRNGVSKGFRLIAFLSRKAMLIKKNYIMKKRIKDLYRTMTAAPKRGCGDET